MRDQARVHTFTEGRILMPLVRFALPVLAALFLQAMYGAVDLLVVGRFGTPADVSAVSTGSQIMMTLTNLVASFAMGATILLGQQIGEGNAERGGETVGACVALFGCIGFRLGLLMRLGCAVIFCRRLVEARLQLIDARGDLVGLRLLFCRRLGECDRHAHDRIAK